MTLDEAKKKTVGAWIEQGLKLSDIQSKLASEMGVTLTYMEVRLLVDDLKLTPKDQPKPQPIGQFSTTASKTAGAQEASAPPVEDGLEEVDEAAAAPGGKGISVSVDQLARPGALVSGNVTFGDGQAAAWYLDQSGRLGIVPQQQGYRPSAADLQTFQVELQKQLHKLGL